MKKIIKQRWENQQRNMSGAGRRDEPNASGAVSTQSTAFVPTPTPAPGHHLPGGAQSEATRVATQSAVQMPNTQMLLNAQSALNTQRSPIALPLAATLNTQVAERAATQSASQTDGPGNNLAPIFTFTNTQGISWQGEW